MLKSKSKMVKPISLPEYRGDRVYMHAFDIANPSMPEGYERWNPTLREIAACSPKKTGIAYVTIDEKIVRKGESHRRGGPHTDGNYLFGWGGGGGWLTGEDGRFLFVDPRMYQMPTRNRPYPDYSQTRTLPNGDFQVNTSRRSW